jgi:hypothetical protein
MQSMGSGSYSVGLRLLRDPLSSALLSRLPNDSGIREERATAQGEMNGVIY